MEPAVSTLRASIPGVTITVRASDGCTSGYVAIICIRIIVQTLCTMPVCRSLFFSRKEAAVAKPAYRAYTVIKRQDADDFWWLNLGVCFPHEDGAGFNLLLQALPLDGKIVLRVYKDEDEPSKGKTQDVDHKARYHKK